MTIHAAIRPKMRAPRPRMIPQASNLADLRTDYVRAELDERSVDRDPLRQFRGWFDEAIAAGLPEPNAMTLATVGANGHPSARVVLLKGADEHGFTFYTNEKSRKGCELASRPLAALLFFWPQLERQVRVEGPVDRVDAVLADAYFASRPHGSRLAARASPQSAPIPDRASLEARFTDVAMRFPDETVPRPPHWGGYLVVPTMFEFWQGRRSRLHDRVVYHRDAAGWRIGRLAP